MKLITTTAKVKLDINKVDIARVDLTLARGTEAYNISAGVAFLDKNADYNEIHSMV